MYFMLF